MIFPATPHTTDDLSFGVRKQPFDPDRDAITYRHTWQLDGQPAAFPPTVPAAQTKKGQRWTLTVVPLDGEAEGKATTVKTLIKNTKPEAPLVNLDRYTPYTDEDSGPLVILPASDKDGDADIDIDAESSIERDIETNMRIEIET